MKIGYANARHIGAMAIAGVVLLHALNGFGCHGQAFGSFLASLAYFVLPALVVAAIGLFTANPLRAATAAAFFAPWLVLAFVTDCVIPYRGGGASMIYVAVLMWGTPCAIVGAFLGDAITRWLRIEVVPQAAAPSVKR